MSYISLSGNIAVGKSTVLSQLEEMGYTTVSEDLGAEFISLLGDYNEDPMNAIHLQNYINEYRSIDAEVSCNADELYIHERSMIDDMIFTSLMVINGEIEEKAGQDFLDAAYEKLLLHPPEKVIYLYSDPESTYSRMISRGRSEESEQSLLDIAELEQAHTEVLPVICGDLGIELVEVDWSNFGHIDDILTHIT